MKQLKKGLLTLLVGVFGLLSVNAQTNLLENGDFKKGTTGWNLGRDFSLGGDSSYPYIQTGYIDQYGAPRVSTDGQTIAVTPGETYVFSFWADGLSENDMSGNFKLKKADDSFIYNIEGIEGVNYNSFKFKKVQSTNGWDLFEKEIVFPANSEVANMTQFGISLVGSNKSYKKITEISMVKKENPAPKDFKVVEDKLNQRVAELSWKAEQGKVYKVNVNNKDYTVSNGNTLVLTDLSPNTEYTASIYAEGTPNAKANTTFKTKDFVEANEEDRVPFLANIDDKKLPAKFLYAVNDLTGGAVENITITFKGEPATIDNGYVTLPASVTEGELIITITQKEEGKTIITYKSITKK